jgi:hypothetical protein
LRHRGFSQQGPGHVLTLRVDESLILSHVSLRRFHIPPNLAVERVTAQRKPPEGIVNAAPWTLLNKHGVGNMPKRICKQPTYVLRIIYGESVMRSYSACYQAMWAAVGDPPMGLWHQGGLINTFCLGVTRAIAGHHQPLSLELSSQQLKERSTMRVMVL